MAGAGLIPAELLGSTTQTARRWLVSLQLQLVSDAIPKGKALKKRSLGGGGLQRLFLEHLLDFLKSEIIIFLFIAGTKSIFHLNSV